MYCNLNVLRSFYTCREVYVCLGRLADRSAEQNMQQLVFSGSAHETLRLRPGRWSLYTTHAEVLHLDELLDAVF